MALYYTGNQLRAITSFASPDDFEDYTPYPVSDSGNAYSYDQNGNTTKDLDRNISSIQYNLLNLPCRITYTDGSMATYTYNSLGEKLRVAYSTSGLTASLPAAHMSEPEAPGGEETRSLRSGMPNTTVDYCGNLIYNGTSLSRILLGGEGYCQLANGAPLYFFFIKDHLGSTRAVVRQDGSARQCNQYYPYGKSWSGGYSQPYLYNGKEIDMMHALEWYDYGARMYEPGICRFMTMDPLCEKYYNISPYAYCANNPVNAIDLHGDSITILDMTSIDAIYNALQPGTYLSMKFNNGVLVPESIHQIVSNSQDSFLQDLYNISINPLMVEVATTYINDYYIDNQYRVGIWSVPEDIDYAKKYNYGQEDQLHPSGKTIIGNLGQTLYPISSGEYKSSANNNIRINLNALGNLNQCSCGIAHEFGHVVLYLSGQPHSHSENGDFIYGSQWNVMKRFGYDYLESSTGKIFR